MTNTFSQVAVAANRVGEVVNDVGTQVSSLSGFGHCHAYRGCEALSQRARRDLDASGMTDFGMTWRGTSPLTEVFDVVERKSEPA